MVFHCEKTQIDAGDVRVDADVSVDGLRKNLRQIDRSLQKDQLQRHVDGEEMFVGDSNGQIVLAIGVDRSAKKK